MPFIRPGARCGWRDARRIPAVAFFHSHLPRLVGSRCGRAAGRLAGRYLRWLYERFDLVLAPSRVMCDYLRSLGLSQRALQPLGVDTTVFHPGAAQGTELRPQLGLPEDVRLLVYAGRFSAEKNIKVLHDAFARLGPRLPPAAGWRRRASDSDAANITVIPYRRDSAALAGLLASGDALVHAGTAETFGLVVLEAMACGRPVVGVRAAAIAELVDDTGRRRRRRVRMAGCWPQAVRELYDRDLDALGRAARQQVEARYSWDSALRRQLLAYASLTEKKRIVPEGWATASARPSGEKAAVPAGPSSNWISSAALAAGTRPPQRHPPVASGGDQQRSVRLKGQALDAILVSFELQGLAALRTLAAEIPDHDAARSGRRRGEPAAVGAPGSLVHLARVATHARTLAAVQIAGNSPCRRPGRWRQLSDRADSASVSGVPSSTNCFDDAGVDAIDEHCAVARRRAVHRDRARPGATARCRDRQAARRAGHRRRTAAPPCPGDRQAAGRPRATPDPPASAPRAPARRDCAAGSSGDHSRTAPSCPLLASIVPLGCQASSSTPGACSPSLRATVPSSRTQVDAALAAAHGQRRAVRRPGQRHGKILDRGRAAPPPGARPCASCHAAEEPRQQFLAIELAADEHQLAGARRARPTAGPGRPSNIMCTP